MLRFELGMEEPDPEPASRSAFTIALCYVAGGMVPLTVYLFFHSADRLNRLYNRHVARPVFLRVHRAMLHQGEAVPQCVSNRRQERPCSGSSVRFLRKQLDKNSIWTSMTGR